MSHSIDNPFISQEEQKHENLKFLRIDADVNGTLREEVKEEDKEALKKQEETLTETFKKALGDDKLQVKVERLKDAEISSMITLSGGNTPYAGYDEDVQHGHGRVDVRRQRSGAGTQREQQARSVRLRAHGWREYAEDLRTALRPGTAQPRFPDTGVHDEVYRTVE